MTFDEVAGKSGRKTCRYFKQPLNTALLAIVTLLTLIAGPAIGRADDRRN